MEYRVLGKTGIRVSRLCFGTLTLGPLQSDLTLKEGVRLLETALDLGVNFLIQPIFMAPIPICVKRYATGRSSR